MKRIEALVLAATVCLSLSARAQAPPLRVDDEIDRIQVASPQMSPDGQWVVFARSDLNWAKNRRESRLYRVSFDGGELRPFTAGPDDRSPRWSPDGRYLAFLRGVPSKKERQGEDGGPTKPKKEDQIWVIPTTAGEAFPLTELSEGVKSFAWAPGSDRILFTASDPPTAEEKKKLEDGDDGIYVFEGPNGQGRDRWVNLWAVGLAEREPRPITREPILISDFDVSPDASQVALVYRTENARNNGNLAELGVVGVKEGRVTRLTDNRAPESKVRFLPSGGELSYLAPDSTSWELAADKLFVLDLATRKSRLVSAGFEGDISNYSWSKDGRRALLAAGIRTNAGIFELDLVIGRAKPLFDRPGVATEVSWTADGSRAAFVWSDALTPPDVHTAELGRAGGRRLTDLNPALRDRTLGAFKVVEWKSRDGLSIEGLLYLPAQLQAGRPVPLVLNIHGGPAGVFVNSWRGEEHILAGLGYASLCPNVRGSSNYGDRFLRANLKDIGGGDYHDLMTGVEKLVADGIADGEKLGLRGWSYGGILGGWVLTQTTRFKAASLGAMVSDWTSEYGQGFNHDVRLWYIGGEPWTNPEGYRGMSPLTYVARVATPTLVLHGEEDTTDTIEQSMNFFNALWERGVPTRFIRFPREPHGLREPRHQRTKLVEEIAWLQKHVRGVDWTDVREEKDETKKPGKAAPPAGTGSRREQP
jgi:dipeptidyl aminopeptidase/acylaminoacyl peptidase